MLIYKSGFDCAARTGTRECYSETVSFLLRLAAFHEDPWPDRILGDAKRTVRIRMDMTTLGIASLASLPYFSVYALRTRVFRRIFPL